MNVVEEWRSDVEVKYICQVHDRLIGYGDWPETN